MQAYVVTLLVAILLSGCGENSSQSKGEQEQQVAAEPAGTCWACRASPLRDGGLRRQPANDGRAWPSRSGRTSRRTRTTGATWALASGSVACDPRAMRSSHVCRPVRCK